MTNAVRIVTVTIRLDPPVVSVAGREGVGSTPVLPTMTTEWWHCGFLDRRHLRPPRLAVQAGSRAPIRQGPLARGAAAAEASWPYGIRPGRCALRASRLTGHPDRVEAHKEHHYQSDRLYLPLASSGEMQLHQLAYALAVAEEQSFTRAAARLHLAQPSLSRQVRLLEGELGVLLFNRGPGQGPVTLTADVARTLLPLSCSTGRPGRRRGHRRRGLARFSGMASRRCPAVGATPSSLGHQRASPRRWSSSTRATPASTSRSSSVGLAPARAPGRHG